MRIKELFGETPLLEYLDCSIVVDNETKEVRNWYSITFKVGPLQEGFQRGIKFDRFSMLEGGQPQV